VGLEEVRLHRAPARRRQAVLLRGLAVPALGRLVRGAAGAQPIAGRVLPGREGPEAGPDGALHGRQPDGGGPRPTAGVGCGQGGGVVRCRGVAAEAGWEGLGPHLLGELHVGTRRGVAHRCVLSERAGGGGLQGLRDPVVARHQEAQAAALGVAGLEPRAAHFHGEGAAEVPGRGHEEDETGGGGNAGQAGGLEAERSHRRLPPAGPAGHEGALRRP